MRTSLVLQAVRDTLFALCGDPKSLGAQPGSIAALPTWGQTLVLHPPGHGVVIGGGLSPLGHWVAVRHGLLRPARVVMAVFRGKWLDARRTALHRGDIQLPEAILLRGLMTCGVCGAAYVGTKNTRGAWAAYYYRCGSCGQIQAGARTRYTGVMINAEHIEQDIWQACQRFILEPGLILVEAQQPLAGMRWDDTRHAAERARLRRAFAEKAHERERAITMSRCGLIRFEELEGQLAASAPETAVLATEQQAMDAQQALLPETRPQGITGRWQRSWGCFRRSSTT